MNGKYNILNMPDKKGETDYAGKYQKLFEPLVV
jgi:hypothetical protein